MRGPRFGPRKDEFLPYLLLRAQAGDRGRRPLGGVFWESPDIYIAPDVAADAAPLLPPTLAGMARATVANTLYAHVWNLGKAPAGRVRVEFWWCNPSLGISRAVSTLVGVAYIDLSHRFGIEPAWRRVEGPSGAYLTKGSHAIVRCPVTWVPEYVNGGHECLVVRAFEPFLDAVGLDEFRPYADRHVAQRNIAVVPAASPAAIDLPLDLGYLAEPGDVVVDVRAEPPSTMEWLRLIDPAATSWSAPPADDVVVGVLPPSPVRAAYPPLSAIDFVCRSPLLAPSQRFHRGCDPLSIGFHAGARELACGQAQIVRVRQLRDGQVIGGYTVALTGPQK